MYLSLLIPTEADDKSSSLGIGGLDSVARASRATAHDLRPLSTSFPRKNRTKRPPTKVYIRARSLTNPRETAVKLNIEDSRGSSMGEPKRNGEMSADENSARPILEPVSPGARAGPRDNSPPPPIKREKSYVIHVVIAIVCVIAGWGPVSRFATNFFLYETTDDAYIHARTATVSSKIGGIVTEVLFDDNTSVRKDDVLVRIDSREYATAIRQLESELAAARALFEEARQELDRGEFDIIVRQRQSELNAAIASFQEAKKELDRGEFDNAVKQRQNELNAAIAVYHERRKALTRAADLHKKGLIAEKELDAAIAAHHDALGKTGSLQALVRQATLAAAKAKDVAIANYHTAKGKRGAAQAQLREAKRQAAKLRDTAVARYHATLAKTWAVHAQLDLAKLNLEYTVIRAPQDGVVGKRKIEPGMVIKPTQSVTTFVGAAERWVVANFKETQMKHIRLGGTVEVEIDSIPGRSFRAVVHSISPGSGSTFALIPPDNATGNFTKIVQRVPIKIVFDADSLRGYESALIPGTSAIVKVRIGGSKPAAQYAGP